MTSELRLRGYSPRTVKVYAGHVERFLHSLDGPAEDVTDAEIRAWLLRLIEERGEPSAVFLNVRGEPS